MKTYADGTKIIVTRIAEERIFTDKEPLFGLVGDVITDFDLYDIDVADIILGDCTFGMHFDLDNILVYFPMLDFCYWLYEGEYELF